jgi:hypothetical protein
MSGSVICGADRERTSWLDSEEGYIIYPGPCPVLLGYAQDVCPDLHDCCREPGLPNGVFAPQLVRLHFEEPCTSMFVCPH